MLSSTMFSSGRHDNMFSSAMFYASMVGVAVWAMLMTDWLPPLLTGLPPPAVNFNIVSIPMDQLPQQPMPFEGALAKNTILQQHAIRLLEGQIQGSESVVVTSSAWGTDAPSHLIMLDKFGDVWVADEKPDGSYELQDGGATAYARLGAGRPLGAHLDKDDNLVICDSSKGLMLLERETRTLVQLAAYISDDSPLDAGERLVYANDLDIGSDGVVYFTTSQDIPVGRNAQGYYDTFHSYIVGLFSGIPAGRLHAFYPHNRTVHALVNGLMYANGVALSADESFVAFTETNRHRVMRYWLKGPQAGSVDVLVDALPGGPDGISLASDGNFWVALVAQRAPMLEMVMKYTLVRAVLAQVPMNRIQSFIKPWGMVIKVSAGGEVVGNLMDPEGSHVAFVSAATEVGNRLYLGNLVQDYVSYVDPTLLLSSTTGTGAAAA